MPLARQRASASAATDDNAVWVMLGAPGPSPPAARRGGAGIGPAMIWTPAGAYELPVFVFVSCACAVAATPTSRESPVPTSSKINCPPLPSNVGQSYDPAAGT